MATARHVRVERIVEDYINDEKRRYTRISDVFDALLWRIARQPDAGYPVSHLSPTRYIIKSAPFRLPVPIQLKLLYRFDDEEVVVEFAQVEAPSDVDQA